MQPPGRRRHGSRRGAVNAPPRSPVLFRRARSSSEPPRNPSSAAPVPGAFALSSRSHLVHLLHSALSRRASRALATLALATSVLPLSAAAQHGAPTLPQLLGDPFPSELVAAPSGGAVAWVFDRRGARDVWVAGPPSWHARAVTHYGADDG